MVKTRAVPYGIELVIGDLNTVKLDSSFFGMLIQYPDINGEANDYRQFVSDAKAKDIQVAFIALNKKGDTGSFAIQKGFTYALKTNTVEKMIAVKSYY